LAPTPRLKNLFNEHELPKKQYNSTGYAALFTEGDEKALSYFFNEFHPALSLFANKFLDDRMLAEEVASNAFVKAWKFHWKVDSYASIRAYLYQIVRNECTDILRLKNRKMVLPKETFPEVVCQDVIFDNLVRSEVSRMIHSALKKLSPDTQQVLTMHYLDGKSLKEIASELNIPHSTIRTQKARGIKNLQKILLPTRTLVLISIIFPTFF
jgi:RNA polymerase sigma-70 factor (ECF subfamily)